MEEIVNKTDEKGYKKGLFILSIVFGLILTAAVVGAALIPYINKYTPKLYKSDYSSKMIDENTTIEDNTLFLIKDNKYNEKILLHTDLANVELPPLESPLWLLHGYDYDEVHPLELTFSVESETEKIYNFNIHIILCDSSGKQTTDIDQSKYTLKYFDGLTLKLTFEDNRDVYIKNIMINYYMKVI